jgi:GrpB-like predicted nucleotidyltransferase (UPF0157 family)
VIDILLAVANAADEAAYVPPLEAVGYRLVIREPGWHEHRMLEGTNPAVNLHVFAQGAAEIRRMLVFRDRLRADAGDRTRYEEAKRALAARSWESVQEYADAKSGVVEEILARALEGAR